MMESNLPVNDVNKFAILEGEVVWVAVVRVGYSSPHLPGGDLQKQDGRWGS